ncbi:MAG: hypothetical protein K2X82_12650 [Gemmataceae bacterium]|nr:hypothetical protein [Gemmataceae bacterium]
MIVMKVGGSLYDHPGLGPGLRAYLAELAPEPVLLVPGGGPFGEAVRQLDAVHGIGEEAAHRIALRSLAAPAAFLRCMLEEPLPPATQETPPPIPLPYEGRGDRRAGSGLVPPPLVGEGDRGRGLSLISVLDTDAFATADPALPHSWAVTTDSIAARAAVVYGASRLVLLKSIDIPPGTPWAEAAARGWVDRHFPYVIAGRSILIEPVNFRRRLG